MPGEAGLPGRIFADDHIVHQQISCLLGLIRSFDLSINENGSLFKLPSKVPMKSIALPIATASPPPTAKSGRFILRGVLIAAAAILVGVMVWQGISAHGNPDPIAPNTSRGAAILDIAILVFREGLECILVLSAITASMVGVNRMHRRPIAMGAGVGFVATVITWFIAVGILSDLSGHVSALALQAGTGLLAVIVLLVVMNWFFHKVYWGGWISLHNRRKRELLEEPNVCAGCRMRLVSGLGLLGFSSLYREGFEVVLFLQSYNLKLGGRVVLWGTLLGLSFTAVVAVLNFVAHQRLPYRKMLVLTGVMLGVVLLVMVGEQAQEMQLAHWIPTTPIPWLAKFIPDWMGLWFSVFPTVESLVAQLIAAVAVGGSYYLAGRQKTPQPSC
ncbi:MAG TPA: FTR1 family protein [Opitutaceae bacterium]|nr:FTR1 family protein [Opitutaceae bacterium]